MLGRNVPDVTLKTRVRDESIGGDNPFKWQDVKTGDLFANQRSVVFSLPGAFTPTCSSSHVPRYNQLADTFRLHGVDDIIYNNQTNGLKILTSNQ